MKTMCCRVDCRVAQVGKLKRKSNKRVEVNDL